MVVNSEDWARSGASNPAENSAGCVPSQQTGRDGAPVAPPLLLRFIDIEVDFIKGHESSWGNDNKRLTRRVPGVRRHVAHCPVPLRGLRGGDCGLVSAL